MSALPKLLPSVYREMAKLTPDLLNQLNAYLEQVATGTKKSKRQAALALLDLGIRERGNIGPRGTIHESAPVRLPVKQYSAFLGCANDADTETRRRIALALGEWGDTTAVTVLSGKFLDEHSEEVRVADVVAAKTIGGREAIAFLTNIACQDESEAVRLVALVGVEELAAGGWADLADREPLPPPARKPDPELSSFIATLNGLSLDRTVPAYLRDRARSAATSIESVA
jgi:hypothetical protein